MSTVEELEQAVEQLDQRELASFREWFEAYEAARWNQQIEEDAVAGKLDALAEQAIAEFEAGKTKQL